MIGRALSVAWIVCHVVQPHRPFAVERRGEHGGRARMRKVRKRFARGARQRVQHVRVAGLGVGHVIEKRAELRVRQLRRDVGDFLDDRLAIERGGDDGTDLAQLLGIASRVRGLPRGDAMRSVMSRATFEAPTTSPRSFRMGETVSEIDSRVPSLCCRTVS